MARKRKRARRRSARHVAAYHIGIVQTPLRRGFECLMVGERRSKGRHWECPTIAELGARLVDGRAAIDFVRTWLNGRRRAPAWFVAVLDGELAKQIEHRQAIREQLARYETGDRRRGPEARARARATRMRQLGRPIGPGEPIKASGIDAGADPMPTTSKPE